jgi:hypothetical protein
MKTIFMKWKQGQNPVKKQCGSTYIDFEGKELADLVYICDEDEGHDGLHMDKVERKAWIAENLRLRTLPKSDEETR